VNSACFSPDGARILTASEDRMARIWDAAGGKELAVLRGHQSAVLAAAFSAGGRRAVTGSKDNTARLWSGRRRASRRG
jgi:WD40 repeat protein